MPLPVLENRLGEHANTGTSPAVICAGQELSYPQLLDKTADYAAQLSAAGVGAADPVLLSCGFGVDAIACFLALLRLDAIAVLAAPDDPRVEQKLAASQAKLHLEFPLAGEALISGQEVRATDAANLPLVRELSASGHPGFVIFSSGSTGEPKAVLHDAQRFTAHLEKVQKAKSTIGFLAFDHIAGVDTLLYTLFAGGTLVVPEDRSPKAVCQAVEAYKAQVLPVSPSFLKLLLVSPALEAHDLSSLEVITFGSEPPDPAVTEKLAKLLPNADLLQKYGTSEFGAPRSKTKPGDSRWIKLTSDDFAVRVVDGVMWVKASGTMLGYLNATDPAEQDGWFCTGDRVEQDGDWLRILGRDSDLINVGGEKVFPAEVETVVESLPGVLECAVTGESHPLLGTVVVATVRLTDELLAEELSDAALKQRVRKHCRGQLPRYAIPVKVLTTTEALTSSRGKRLRN